MNQVKAVLKVSRKVGSMTELANRLGCSKSYVSKWSKGERKVPIKYVKKLVEISEGEIRKRDLRPDVYDE